MASGQGSVNRVILIGNCGRDPETRALPSGDAVTNLSIATSETWKDRQSGERRERTEWHSLVFFGRTAEVARDYLRKGSKIYVEGSLRTRQWEKDGVTRYSTEVVVDQMTMLSGKGEAVGGGSGGGYSPRPSAPDSGGAAGGYTPPSTPSTDSGGSGSGGQEPLEDDDIPF